MAEGSDEITKAAMIRILGRQFSTVGQQGEPQLQKKKSEKDLPEAPYPVNEFLYFLLNNRINLVKIYKDNLKSKMILITQLQELLKKYHYKGSSPDDIEIVIKFFKSNKDETKILLNKIIVYARQIDPAYGKDTGEEGDAAASKQVTSKFPHAIKRTLKKLSDYLRDNRVTKELLFE